MLNRVSVYLFVVFLFTAGYTYGQNVDSLARGVVKGIAWDSAHNYALSSATVAVYKIADTSLIQFTITNDAGEFVLKKITIDLPLRIVISYTGYSRFVRRFTIKANDINYDFGKANLNMVENMLKDVEITAVPPVTVKGDTIEFNADAFSLDKNSVVEDLMRKLPGVTIWGDGVITINGKKVQRVYVNGKQFFGGDPKIALQNLPKNSVDKIQVYSKADQNSFKDSTLNVNIKLKDSKSKGLFGKASAGLGTSSRYESDVSLNAFSSQTQLSVAGALNNINKRARDVTTLIRNSSYKGVGTDRDYETSFEKSGETKSGLAGFLFRHDFKPTTDESRLSNYLEGNYLFNNDQTSILNNSLVTTAITGGNNLFEKREGARYVDGYGHKFTTGYKNDSRDRSFSVSTNADFNNSKVNNSDMASAENSLGERLSTSDTKTESNNENKEFALHTAFENRPSSPSSAKGRGKLNRYAIEYDFIYKKDNSDSRRFVTLQSQVSDFNQYYDRKYDSKNEYFGHKVNFRYNNLGQLITNDPLFLDFNFTNKLELGTNSKKDLVQDVEPGTNVITLNRYLTNNNTYLTFNEMPNLQLSKSLEHKLSDRYIKSLNFYLNLQGQFSLQHNKSDKDFQNIDRWYNRFVPSAGIEYVNNQLGDYEQKLNLQYNTTVGIPSMEQLAPLTDSTNVYTYLRGNANLNAFYKQEVTLSFQSTSSGQGRKNEFSYRIALTAGKIKNNISDSSSYDNIGRRTVYYVNVDGYRYLKVDGNVSYYIPFERSNLQFKLNTYTTFSRSPNYINGRYTLSNNNTSTNFLNVYYQHEGVFSLNLIPSLTLYRSRQIGALESTYKNRLYAAKAVASVNLYKSVNLSSDISYTSNHSDYARPINYSLWNAFIAYRFLSGKNAEVKLSAMDILRQNRNIKNFINDNISTVSVTNGLQNFYMVTFSFYPRKFGK